MKDSKISNSLLESLKKHNSLPYLFIGSGISRRYLGLPNWEGLLNIFTEDLSHPFNYYLSKSDGDYSRAATEIAKEFNNIWWDSEKYADSRNNFENKVKTLEAPFKLAVSEFINNWDSAAWLEDQENKKELINEIGIMKKAVVDGVITTNYDSFVKDMFPSFKEYIGQDDILLSDAQFIAEIFKIHGSSNDFKTLVLTNSDYTQYLNRSHYLTAKLLTIFAEHPVIFLGYSITDEYIGKILNNIAEAVGPERLDELGSRIYFIQFNSSPEFMPTIENTSQGHGTSQLPMTKIETNSFAWIWHALSQLERPFPAALLRELKHHVFELINNPLPGQSVESIKAVAIDSEDAQGLKVVFGVAAVSDTDLEDISSLSARILTREDLAEDILGIRKRKLDPENVLSFGISKGIRANKSYYVPTYKYLYESGRLDSDDPDFSNLPEIIKILSLKDISLSESSQKKFDELFSDQSINIEDIHATGIPNYLWTELIIIAINKGRYGNIEEIKKILLDLYHQDESKNKTSFYKLLCAYDRKLYKNKD